jgi:penicillin-binding protein 1A
MPIKTTCTHCHSSVPLSEPLPLPGESIQCGECGASMIVSYPEGILEALKGKGKQFAAERPTAPLSTPREGVPKVRASRDAPSEKRLEDPPPPSQFEADVTHAAPSRPKRPGPSGKGRTRWPVKLMASIPLTFGAMAGLAVLLTCLTAGGSYLFFSQGLPTVDTLQAYRPPTVTVVQDRHGEILGEIYEERRYVVSLDAIPEHVQHAFIAAEDASFWKHSGVDYFGIVRAMLRNLAKGKMAQGASTITQQVARNFLLTRDKKLTRKIKEVLLSWRIEETYTKTHILYLYLNEIYLGSHAYGVEAASRTYFDKSVGDLTIAEAALLAGLPQRPSDYSPHRHWEKAHGRQGYVLRQMVSNGYITPEEAREARAEHIHVTPRTNTFLEKAPHFTEYARRYLVEKYGEDRVLRDGLIIRTTCDLKLQTVAQQALIKGVHEVDQRMGLRRSDLRTLGDDAAIEAYRSEQDTALRQVWAKKQDAAGRVELPPEVLLSAEQELEGVVLEVSRKWVRIGIGRQEGIVPLSWSQWAFPPNPRRSWRFRKNDDLAQPVDNDLDGTRDSAILVRGDIVPIKVVALSTQEPKLAKVFRGSPGEQNKRFAVRLWPNPEVEGALLSMELETGAIRAMVGGSDFTESQFNRTLQSRRQVGSTFKPIVYAAALESRRLTTASIVPDAPLAFTTTQDHLWKPTNYGQEYLGNLTLRQALAKSKNTCTVRVLESLDPGMNEDIIYNLGRRLGIGGDPTAWLDETNVPTPENDWLCPWILETPKSTVCPDRYPAKDPNLTNTRHRQLLQPDDEYWCRLCDMTLGLGSASLTMEELVRSYSPFASGGDLVQPYYIEEVFDRDGQLIESHEPIPPISVMEPEVASLTAWLLHGVVRGGTGFGAYRDLKLDGLGGKTGTTNDEKDTWFVGFTNDVVTAAWVGYDQPRSLGISSTGGRTALPIWIDYMRVAAPKSRDRALPLRGNIEWAQIEESTGRRVSSGGVRYPFIRGTVPETTGVAAGQMSMEEFATEF